MKGSPAHVIAGCFALAAFAVAVIAGLAGGNGTGPILVRSLAAMLLCYPIGLVIGLLLQRVVEEHARPEPPTARSAEQNAKDAEQSYDAAAA